MGDGICEGKGDPGFPLSLPHLLYLKKKIYSKSGTVLEFIRGERSDREAGDSCGSLSVKPLDFVVKEPTPCCQGVVLCFPLFTNSG